MHILPWMKVKSLPSFKVAYVWEIKNFMSIFLEISPSIWMKFSMLAKHVGLLSLVLNLVCTSNVQGKELCWRDVMKLRVPDQKGVSQAWYIVEIHLSGRKPSKYTLTSSRHILCPDTCEPIRWKLSMMQYTANFNSLIAVCVTRGHRQAYGKAGTCSVILL